MHRAPYVNHLYCAPRVLGIMKHDGTGELNVIPNFGIALKHNWLEIKIIHDRNTLIEKLLTLITQSARTNTGVHLPVTISMYNFSDEFLL